MLDPLPEADRRARLSPVRIVGVGSPFGADRIGWEVVRQLEAEGLFADLPEGEVALACEDRPGVRLLEWLAAPGLVLLVDAVQSAGAGEAPLPGTLHEFDGRALPAAAGFLTSHDFGMKAALELADALGEMAPEIRVFGIEIDIGESGGDPVKMVSDSGVINKIKELVYNHTKRHQY